jgi:hypothetical protein
MQWIREGSITYFLHVLQEFGPVPALISDRFERFETVGINGKCIIPK